MHTQNYFQELQTVGTDCAKLNRTCSLKCIGQCLYNPQLTSSMTSVIIISSPISEFWVLVIVCLASCKSVLSYCCTVFILLLLVACLTVFLLRCTVFILFYFFPTSTIKAVFAPIHVITVKDANLFLMFSSNPFYSFYLSFVCCHSNFGKLVCSTRMKHNVH